MLVKRRGSEQQVTGILEDRKFRLIGRGMRESGSGKCVSKKERIEISGQP